MFLLFNSIHYFYPDLLLSNKVLSVIQWRLLAHIGVAAYV